MLSMKRKHRYRPTGYALGNSADSGKPTGRNANSSRGSVATATYTEGNITRQILTFAWPILLSSVFQEFYNVTNSLIVGNFIDVHALSVVSASSWICNIFSYMFFGLGMGAGILIANYAGSGDQERLKGALDTSLVFAVGGGIILTVAAEILLPVLMGIINIGPDLYADAEVYLRVYLIGNTAVLTYQMCFFILRSFGDSKHPLYFLIISSIINLILGFIFVRFLHLNVVGTALATIIAQYTVDVLSLRLLFKLDGMELDLKHLAFSWENVRRICSLGIPAGIQNMLIAVSGVLVQSYVNTFPNEVISGIGVAERICNWGQHPSMAMSTTCMTLVGQNLGARKYDRVQEIVRKTLLFGLVATTGYVIVIMLFAPQLVSLFNSDQLVRAHGAEMIRYAMFSYILLTFCHMYNAACRAAGNVSVPMFISVLGQCITKYVFVRIGLALFYDVHILYLGSAIGYSAAGIMATLYFNLSPWTREAHLRP